MPLCWLSVANAASLRVPLVIRGPGVAVRPGGIDLPTLQKYLNFHFSVSLDLFGQEASTNAANYYTMGVKGRYLETRIDDDHLLTDAAYEIETVDNGRIVKKSVPADRKSVV